MKILLEVAELLRQGHSDAEVSRRTGVHPVKVGDARRALRLPSFHDMRKAYVAPDSHRPHGSRAKYTAEKCHCKPCRQANRKAMSERSRLLAYGQWNPFVDAAPVREHIHYLQSCGMGLRTIAAAANVNRKTFQAILKGRPARDKGPQDKVRPTVAAAILAIEPTLETLAPSTPISPLGTRRRIHALVAAGWPQHHLAARLGMFDRNFSQMLTREHVLVYRARAVIALYEELWQADPAAHGVGAQPISRAVNQARANGWAPAGAWDDETIDDPAAFPDWTGQCGTPRGYAAHLRHRILPACPPCNDARNNHRKGLRAVSA